MERRGGCCVTGSHAQHYRARIKVPVTKPTARVVWAMLTRNEAFQPDRQAVA